jgi:hypothetical protein
MFNAVDTGAALARPGMDPRQWVSYGVVDRETDGQKSVIFDDPEGGPLTYGPLVRVTLQPSGIPVVCRVANAVAGQDEGEWFPFLEGDEVIVAIPEGNERAGCVILGRLNQEIDRWPRTVGGMDATKNTIAFRRLRTPYVLETAHSYQVRSALTGAGFTIDAKGNFILASGDKHQLLFTADFLALKEGTGQALVQIDTEDLEVLIQSKGAQFLFSSVKTSFSTPGEFSISASGTSVAQHAVTLEQVVNLFINFIYLLNTAAPSMLLSTTILNPAGFPGALQTALVTWLTSAGAPTPPTAAAGGGGLAAFPLVYGPTGIIGTTLAGQLANTDITGFIPGIGRPGFMY